jgi:hypothetical protein
MAVSRGTDRGGVDLSPRRLGLGLRVARLHRLRIGLEPPLAGEVRKALADGVEGAGEDDRRERTQHHRRQHLGEDHPLLLAEDRRIADRKRDRTLADAARHDRHDDEEERLVGTEPQQSPDQRADQGRGDGADPQGREDLEEALDQDLAVHAKDRADDDRRDVDVEEVGELGEVGDRLHHLRRHQGVVDERRGDEGREDRSGADILQNRNPLADFRAGEAAHHQHGDHGRPVGLDLALLDEDHDQNRQDEVDRQRYDADLGVDQTPPAVRPEPGRLLLLDPRVNRRRDRTWRGGAGHGRPPGCRFARRPLQAFVHDVAPAALRRFTTRTAGGDKVTFGVSARTRSGNALAGTKSPTCSASWD